MFWTDARQFEKLHKEAQASSETQVSSCPATAGPEYRKSPVYLFMFELAPLAWIINKDSVFCHTASEDNKDFAERSQLL